MSFENLYRSAARFVHWLKTRRKWFAPWLSDNKLTSSRIIFLMRSFLYFWTLCEWFWDTSPHLSFRKWRFLHYSFHDSCTSVTFAIPTISLNILALPTFTFALLRHCSFPYCTIRDLSPPSWNICPSNLFLEKLSREVRFLGLIFLFLYRFLKFLADYSKEYTLFSDQN